MNEIYYIQRKERGDIVELARIEKNEITIIDLMKKEVKDKIKIKENILIFIEQANYETISRKTWYAKLNREGLEVSIQPTQLNLFQANQLSLF